MRVTEQMRLRQTLKHVQQLNQRQNEAAEQISTGQRVERPSQDTPAWAAANRHEQTLSRVASFKEAGHMMEQNLDLVDSSMGQLHNIMTRARELSMEFSSGLHDQALLDQAAQDVRSLMESARDVANTQLDGKYIFSGVSEDTPTLDASFNFQGSAQRREVEIAPGTKVSQADGASVFAGPDGATAVLESLASAIEQGRLGDARQLQDQIDGVLERAEGVQYRAGSQIQTVRQAHALFDALSVSSQGAKDHLVGADLITSISSFEQARQSLSAVAELSSRARQMDTFLKF